ncbi:transcription factor bHLH95 [Cannabis sativa]|uniref:transcription factor bHLH95 n=1 Tax=Cannabis sativa TaxID=3483 RepID=UPI0029CA95FB|nr:transcription factor bHLH95 [Cannabis sativa]
MSQGELSVLLMGTDQSSTFLQWDENNPWLLPNPFSNLENYSLPAADAGNESAEQNNKMAAAATASNSDGGGGLQQGVAPEPNGFGLVNNNKRGRGGGNVGVCNKKGKRIMSSTTTTEDDDQPAGVMIKNEGKDGNRGGGGGGDSDHEIHIWTERERRKKMRNMFANLHALLPQLPSKADKSTIVDEAVNYIRNLQQTLDKLEKQKLEKVQATHNTFHDQPPSSSSSIMNILNNNNNNNNNNNPQLPKLVYLPANNNNNNNPSSNNNNVVFHTWISPNVVLNLCGEEAHINVCSPKKAGLFTSICHVLDKYKISIISAQISSHSIRNMFMIHARVSGVGSDEFFEAFNSVEELYKQAVSEIALWVPSN